MSERKSVPPPPPPRPSVVDALERLVGPLDEILVLLQASDKRLEQAEVMQRKVSFEQRGAMLAVLVCMIVACVFGGCMITKIGTLTDRLENAAAKLDALRTESSATRAKVEETKERVEAGTQPDVELRPMPSPPSKPKAMLVIKPKAAKTSPSSSALPELPPPEIQIPVALPQGSKVEEKK